MMARELTRQDIDEADRDRLNSEIETFDEAVPAAKDARDVIEHFDEYARGEGKLAKQAREDLAIDAFEAAARYWGGGYDPATEKLTEGPFEILVPDAISAAERMHAAIYSAGRAIDQARAPSS
jgi:predicted RNA-binding Zn ribbon-like protein